MMVHVRYFKRNFSIPEHYCQKDCIIKCSGIVIWLIFLEIKNILKSSHNSSTKLKVKTVKVIVLERERTMDT